jgi:hypothetical protein
MRTGRLRPALRPNLRCRRHRPRRHLLAVPIHTVRATIPAIGCTVNASSYRDLGSASHDPSGTRRRPLCSLPSSGRSSWLGDTPSEQACADGPGGAWRWPPPRRAISAPPASTASRPMAGPGPTIDSARRRINRPAHSRDETRNSHAAAAGARPITAVGRLIPPRGQLQIDSPSGPRFAFGFQVQHRG